MSSVISVLKQKIPPCASPKNGAAILGAEDRAIFFDVIEATMLIGNQEQFCLWTRTELQRIFPHGIMMCGMSRTGKERGCIQQIMGCNIPQEYLQTLQHPDGQVDSPVFAKWTQEQQPILIEPDCGSVSSAFQSAWLNNFRRFGLINLAAHGQCDVNNQTASYFKFSRIPGPLSSRHAHLLRLLVPYLHVVLTRIVAKQPVKAHKPVPQQSQLTARETEILKWLCSGKSNWEIAQVLSISEATVKHHVHHILARLNVNSRTQAVAKAMNLKLIRPKLALFLYAGVELALQGQELFDICCVI